MSDAACNQQLQKNTFLLSVWQKIAQTQHVSTCNTRTAHFICGHSASMQLQRKQCTSSGGQTTNTNMLGLLNAYLVLLDISIYTTSTFHAHRPTPPQQHIHRTTSARLPSNPHLRSFSFLCSCPVRARGRLSHLAGQAFQLLSHMKMLSLPPSASLAPYQSPSVLQEVP